MALRREAYAINAAKMSGIIPRVAAVGSASCANAENAANRSTRATTLLADEVWELWNDGLIPDELAAIAWWVICYRSVFSQTLSPDRL